MYRLAGMRKLRAALVEHLFDAVAGALERTHVRALSGVRSGIPPASFQKVSPHPGLAPPDGVGRGQLFQFAVAARVGLRGQVAQIVGQAARVFVVRRAREARSAKTKAGRPG